MNRAAAPSALLALALLGCGDTLPVHEGVSVEGAFVRIPLSVLEDGEAHFFTFDDGGTRVNFLVRTDGAGTLHAHLDACYSCFHYRRGFALEGREVVCRACRYAYAVEDEVWDYIGACAPIPIRFTVVERELRIDPRVLERAGRYF